MERKARHTLGRFVSACSKGLDGCSNGRNGKGCKNLAEDLENEDVPALYFPLEPAEFPRGRVSVLPGALSGGFGYPHEKFYAFTYGRNAVASKKEKAGAGLKRDRASTHLMSLKRATTLFIRSTV